MKLWKDIPGYEGFYQADIFGNIRSIRFKKQKKLKFSFTKTGYLKIKLTDKYGKQNTHQVHRLIALTFLPNSQNLPIVHHKNNIRSDNNIENLEWVNQKYNVLKKNKLYITLSKKEKSIVDEFSRMVIKYGVEKCYNILYKIKGEK